MKKILAIDDQPDNLTTLKAVIKMLMPNIEVLTAQSGEQGILLAKENNPDVILLDIIMPKMDGYEVCRILKSDQKTSHIPVAMMTALKTDSESKVKALELGAEVFIAKPIESVELRAQLKVLLRTKEAEDKLREERDNLNDTVRLRTKELAENEYKYRLLVESSQESILVIQKGIVQYVNPVTLSLSGYKEEELVGSSFIEYIHADDQEFVLNNHKKRLEGKSFNNQFDFRIVCKSGKILWFNLIANKIEWKGEMAFLYVLHDITEKKEIENQISLQNQYIETIHLNAPINFWIFEIRDGKYYFVYQNEQASQKIKVRNNELIGKELSEIAPRILSNEDVSIMIEKLSEVVRTKKPVKTKGPIEIKGELYWFMAVYSPLFNEKGEIYRIISSSVSIDEQIEKENKLIESEFKFRSFLEQFQGIAFRKNNKQTLDLIEGNVEGITGYKIEDFRSGKVTFDKIIHPEDFKKVKEEDRNFIKSDSNKLNSEYRIITANGSIRWIAETTTKYSANQQTLIYGSLQDISEIKEAITMLEESNTFNQSLVDTLPFPLQIVDETGNILFMNPVFENLVGKEKLGSKCWQTYRDDKKQCDSCPLLKNLPIGHINKTEFSKVLGGKTFEITYRSMLFDGKKALMEIFVDTTERKQYEEELVRAKNQALESDKLKSAFLANMSHEIRTPMNGILGFLDLLEDVNLSQDEREHFIGIIKSSGDRLLNTINDIIELSKIEAGQIPIKLTENNLGENIRYLTEFFDVEAKAKGIKLNSKKSDCIIRTDFNKLDSVLTNLIKNAIKFTESGTISFGYEPKNDKLQFYVKDTGRGISAEQIDIVFDRFIQADNSFSRAYEGSGLGLSISKAYVQMLGGEIWVESEIGKGSTFYFTIDLLPTANQKTPCQNQKQTKLGNEKTRDQILIAEDDELSYLLLESLLAESNCDLIRAINGKEAIEKLEENPSISIILMDLKMPEMDGLTATRKIRQFNTEIPIIAQTAFVLLGDKEKAIEAGCNDYISKPIIKFQLLQLLDKYLK